MLWLGDFFSSNFSVIQVGSFTIFCFSPRPQHRLSRSSDLLEPLASSYYINSRIAMGLIKTIVVLTLQCMNVCKQNNDFCPTIPCFLDNSHSIYNATSYHGCDQQGAGFEITYSVPIASYFCHTLQGFHRILIESIGKLKSRFKTYLVGFLIEAYPLWFFCDKLNYM